MYALLLCYTKLCFGLVTEISEIIHYIKNEFKNKISKVNINWSFKNVQVHNYFLIKIRMCRNAQNK